MFLTLSTMVEFRFKTRGGQKDFPAGEKRGEAALYSVGYHGTTPGQP